ncbi:hypothetical protein PW683_17325 [Streptomyces niveus]
MGTVTDPDRRALLDLQPLPDAGGHAVQDGGAAHRRLRGRRADEV